MKTTDEAILSHLERAEKREHNKQLVAGVVGLIFLSPFLAVIAIILFG